MLKLPVVLLSFANNDDGRPLETKSESSALKDALLLVEHEGLVNVEREESVNMEELHKRLINYYDDLVIFHFAGHADSTDLLLEDGEVAGKGTAKMLGQAPHLQLVFLNACETREQAEAFLDHGVKIVIATSWPINDTRAIKFSRAFYESLSRKDSIEDAFERAKAYMEVEADSGALRSLNFGDEGEVEERTELPWRLYYRESRHLSWKIDIDIKIFLNLRLGSQRFLQKLLAGPFIHHQNLIASQEADFGKDDTYVSVILNQKEEHLLPIALENLWMRDKSHTWLYGAPGAGKTGSALQLWNRYLHFGRTAKNIPVPIFVDLEEYKEGEESYIINFISKYYLELEGYSEDSEKEAINKILGTTLSSGIQNQMRIPAVILFLDGSLNFGNHLYQEIEKLSRYPGLQIVCTTSKPNAEEILRLGFHSMEIKPLVEDEIKDRIKEDLGSYRQEIRELVTSNRLWLSLFYEFYDKIQAEENQEGYFFIQDFNTEGEFLWNYFEARLLSQTNGIQEIGRKRSSLNFYRFFVRHFIPLLAYRMQVEERNELTEDELMQEINEISHHFYQPWFLKAFPEYRRDFKNFLLLAEDWVAESERLAVIIDLCKDFSIFIEGFKTYSVIQPGKEFVHLQKVRTYRFSNSYFAQFLSATHIWQNAKASLIQGTLPETLRENKINPPVRKMLGHLDRISRNSEEQVLIKILERCRGVFDQLTLGETIWNILNVWNDVKGYLMGISLVKLDLRGIQLSRLSKELTYEPYFLSSDLSMSLVNWQDIFFDKGGYVIDFVYSGNGDIIVTGESDGTIRLWDTEYDICYKIIEGHEVPISSVCLTNEGRYIISAGAEGSIKFWDQHTEVCLLEQKMGRVQDDGSPSGILDLAYHPIPGEVETKFWLLSSCIQDHSISVWKVDLEQREANLQHELAFHQDAIRSVDMHIFEDGSIRIIAGSWDNTVSIWDGVGGNLLGVLDMHVSRVHCVSFSEDGKYFASGSSDDTVIVWKTEDPNHYYRRLKGHTRGIDSLEFKFRKAKNKKEKDQFHLISAASDDKIIIWDLSEINWGKDSPNNLSTKMLKHHILPLGYAREVNCIRFDPQSEQFSYATSDGRLRIWDLRGDRFTERNILYNTYELHVQGCRFRDLHPQSNLFERETSFMDQHEGEKEVTKEMLLRQYGAIIREEDEEIWNKIVVKMSYV
ncbi:MAG: CHAT domain-containing protein [Bacteroidota bacterium]